jgi:hypothetical protein
MVGHSSLIFAGTVKKLNATAGATNSGGTAVVRVDEVIYNAGVVTDIAGKNITVELLAPGNLKAGEREIFYTNVDSYGDSIVVREIGREPFNTSRIVTIRTQAGKAAMQISDEKLQNRVAQAELIVVGRVSAVRPHEPGPHIPPSEHDPDWWEATLTVQAVEKGQAPPGELDVLFPHSKDVRWFASPKFQQGQEGIFLLLHVDDRKLGVSGYTALDPLDFQPMDQLQRVRKMTGNQR